MRRAIFCPDFQGPAGRNPRTNSFPWLDPKGASGAMLTSAKRYRSRRRAGRFVIVAAGIGLAFGYPAGVAFSQSPPVSPGSTYAPATAPATAPTPAVPSAPSNGSSTQSAPSGATTTTPPSAQRRVVPVPPERIAPPTASSVPDGRLECGWVGTRIISLLVRDDIDGANQYQHFYANFGCANEHLAQAFRCTVGGGQDLSGAPLNDRISGCWANPGMSRPLAAPAGRGAAEGQPAGSAAGGQPASVSGSRR